MSRDFETKDIDMVAIELEARRLRARARARGVRSVRNWTMAAFRRNPTVRAT